MKFSKQMAKKKLPDLKFWPWDNGEKPYWVNPKNGIEWYVDKQMSRYCTEDKLNNAPKLEAVCFLLAENKDGEKEPITRALVDAKTNEVLFYDTSLDGMSIKIDMLRFKLGYEQQDKDGQN